MGDLLRFIAVVLLGYACVSLAGGPIWAAMIGGWTLAAAVYAYSGR